ncbi:DUF2201 family putative metallopeptidase [Pyrolobus fumarii]|uniref:DUF2201 family putative metallopeptidase n=1 Tax=Pyrolobus fumarii TaxID=54252 RepID=UPI001FCB681D|nr:hypothetical protein [Pyrolobus fumarii]
MRVSFKPRPALRPGDALDKAAVMLVLCRLLGVAGRVASASTRLGVSRLLREVEVFIAPVFEEGAPAFTDGRRVYIDARFMLFSGLAEILDIVVLHELVHVGLAHPERSGRLVASGVSPGAVLLAADYIVFRRLVEALGAHTAGLLRRWLHVDDKLLDWLLSTIGEGIEEYRDAPLEVVAEAVDRALRHLQAMRPRLVHAVAGDQLNDLERFIGSLDGLATERRVENDDREHRMLISLLARMLRRVLRRVSGVERSRLNSYQRTPSRPSRRLGSPPTTLYAPGGASAPRLYALIDTSLSIPSWVIAEAARVVAGAARRLGYRRVYTILWSDRPYFAGSVPSRRLVEEVASRAEGGGTLLAPALRLVSRLGPQRSAIVILSDFGIADDLTVVKKLLGSLRASGARIILVLMPGFEVRDVFRELGRYADAAIDIVEELHELRARRGPGATPTR